ncbi:MAG: S1 RNA-binding domain-containing protein [Saprospiraceae bacterium]
MKSQLVVAENYIKKGELMPAIDALYAFLETKRKNAYFKDVLIDLRLYQSKTKSLFRDFDKGLIDRQHYDLTLSKNCKGVIQIIESLKENEIEEDDIGFLKFSGETNSENNHTETLVKEEMKELEITLNRNFEDFNEIEKEKLILAIKELMGINGDLNIKIRKGSVKVIIDLPAGVAERLKDLVELGALADFDISKIEIKDVEPEDENILTNLPTSLVDVIDTINAISEIAGEKIYEEVVSEIENEELAKNRLISPIRRAKLLKAWENIVDSFKNDRIVIGTVISKTKGGLIVDCGGLEVFLPGSQIDVRPIVEYDEYIGKVMEFKVIKVVEEIKNAVVSHKKVIEGDLEE